MDSAIGKATQRAVTRAKLAKIKREQPEFYRALVELVTDEPKLLAFRARLPEYIVTEKDHAWLKQFDAALVKIGLDPSADKSTDT
jgi:hypothetical protein